MNKSYLNGALYAVLLFLVSMSANAALYSRLGGDAAYDDVLDITWVTNAALSGDPNGTWFSNNEWASNLNYLGFDDWRLASMAVSGGVPTGAVTSGSVIDCRTATEEDCRDNELGYMYYYNLGGTIGDDLRGNQTAGEVALTDIQWFYMSGTEYTFHVPMFTFSHGSFQTAENYEPSYGWAVRSGDVVVPVPAAVWLFGTGLLSLVSLARRNLS